MLRVQINDWNDWVAIFQRIVQISFLGENPCSSFPMSVTRIWHLINVKLNLVQGPNSKLFNKFLQHQLNLQQRKKALKVKKFCWNLFLDFEVWHIMTVSVFCHLSKRVWPLKLSPFQTEIGVILLPCRLHTVTKKIKKSLIKKSNKTGKKNRVKSWKNCIKNLTKSQKRTKSKKKNCEKNYAKNAKKTRKKSKNIA